MLIREDEDARFGDNLCGGGSWGHDVWVGDMGDDTAHWQGFGRIPPQCFPQANWTTTLERARRWMGVSYYVGSNGKGGITGSGDLLLMLPQHSCKVHCNWDHYGPVSGVGEVSRVKYFQSVVGRRRDADSGLGGGTDGEGG